MTYLVTELQCEFFESIVVNVNLQPNSEAGEDVQLDCEKTFVTLDGENSSTFGNSIWTTVNGNFVNGFNDLLTEVNAPAVYFLTIECIQFLTGEVLET